jgi:hypothetical protein
MNPLLFPTVFTCLLAAPAVCAAVVTYDFTGPTAGPSSVGFGATATDFTLSSSSLALASLVFGNSAPSAVAAGWNGSAGAQAFEFTVTADPGNQLELTGLSFDNFAVDPPDLFLARNGPQFFDVLVNGVAVSSGNATSLNAWGTVTIPFVFSGTSALVQIFGYGGTAGLALTAGWAVDNVALEGAAVVPEPGSCAVLSALALAGFAAGQRRRAAGAKRADW